MCCLQGEVEALQFPEKHEMLHKLDQQTGPQFQRLNAAVSAAFASQLKCLHQRRLSLPS